MICNPLNLFFQLFKEMENTLKSNELLNYNLRNEYEHNF